jgi:hypothetical protein
MSRRSLIDNHVYLIFRSTHDCTAIHFQSILNHDDPELPKLNNVTHNTFKTSFQQDKL